MANIENLERQHEDIQQLFTLFKKQLNTPILDANVDELVKSINTLAGKLKIHMGTEDRFLYPELSASENPRLKALSKSYNSEMLSLSETFNVYKNQYNTRSKILANTTGFLTHSRDILKQLEDRISKEDRELYPLLKGGTK